MKKRVLLLLLIILVITLLVPSGHALTYFVTLDLSMGGPEAYVPGFQFEIDFASIGHNACIMQVNRTLILPTEDAKPSPTFSSCGFQTNTVNNYLIRMTMTYDLVVNQTVLLKAISGGELIPTKSILVVASIITIIMNLQTVKKPSYPTPQEVASQVQKLEAQQFQALSTKQDNLEAYLKDAINKIGYFVGAAFLLSFGLVAERMRQRFPHGW